MYGSSLSAQGSLNCSLTIIRVYTANTQIDTHGSESSLSQICMLIYINVLTCETNVKKIQYIFVIE